MELWVTTPNVNLGKLVPLEVHGRLRNAKKTKKYFPMLEWGVHYTQKRYRIGLSNKLRNMPIGYLVREIQPLEIPGLKVGNSQECPESVPERPPRPKGGWGSYRGLQKHMYGRWCLSLSLGRCESSFGS